MSYRFLWVDPLLRLFITGIRQSNKLFICSKRTICLAVVGKTRGYVVKVLREQCPVLQIMTTDIMPSIIIFVPFLYIIGLLLASFLNAEVKLSTILSNIWTTFSNQEGWCTYNNRTRSSRFRDEILSSAMYEWDQNREENLTSIIF